MSSSESEDDSYTNTGSIFGKITTKAKEELAEPQNISIVDKNTSINLESSINDIVIDKKRKSDLIEVEDIPLTKRTRGDKTGNSDEEIPLSRRTRGKNAKNSQEIQIIDTITLENSQNSSLNDSVDVIEQINAALERNGRGRGRRKSAGTPRGAKSKVRGRGRNRRNTRQTRAGPQVIATIELDVDYPILNSNNFISNIDLGEEISVKVLWKSQSYQKFELRKKEKLDKIFKYYAEKEGVSEELLYFSFNDIIVCKNDTPESLKLNVASIIEGGILSSKTHLSSGYKQNTIELKIQWKNLKRPFIYNMNVTDEMSVLMRECSKEMKVPLDRLKFRFDGEVIEPDDTPSSLDLEGGECIDCIEK